MSKQSDAVKRWRERTKSKMADAFGGSCGICGYSKCNKALVFHHLDPTQKEFSLGAIRASIKSWEKIAKELEKCVMLCQNCHMEHHAGFVDIPQGIKRFDPTLLEDNSPRVTT